MWDLEQYVDETIVNKCRKSFSRVYPEFEPIFLGASQDKNVSDALEKYCADSRMSKTAVVEIAVTEYLEKQKKTKKK